MTLPDDGRAEKRKLLCAPLEARPHLRFCTTHITTLDKKINGVEINVQQLDAVRARVKAWHAAGDTVIIAGDFNAQPNYERLDEWYAPSVNTANNRGNTGATGSWTIWTRAAPGTARTARTTVRRPDRAGRARRST